MRPSKPLRSPLGRVLLRKTLALMLVLGLAAAAATMWIDLKREKSAVETGAREFLTSVVPSATTAAYNFDTLAVQSVVTGLFAQRAVTAVRIVNDGEDMIHQTRDVAPTLPNVAFVASRDIVVISRPLFSLRNRDQVFGSIVVTVDRSIVEPEIVDRLLTFFLITTAKNVLFGILLYLAVFAALARYTTDLSARVRSWRPESGQLKAPPVPRLLRDTEIADLGGNFEDLTGVVGEAITELEVSRDAAVDFNDVLREAVEARTVELETANKHLKQLAETDGLTGLYNRAYLERFLARALETSDGHAPTISVLLIDIDHFKAFNDHYGHQAADEALMLFAGILHQVGSEGGHMAARYGGEEFAVVIKAGLDTAMDVAEKLHHLLELASIYHESSTTARWLTVSIGVASTDNRVSEKTPHALLSAADDALYEAKQKGRNQTIVTSRKIRRQTKDKRDMVQSLLRAIENREFEPFLQPQVNARTGKLVGAEALVRWVREDGSTVPPGVFMQAATQSGLIASIDVLTLETLRETFDGKFAFLPQLSLNVIAENVEDERYVEGILELAKTCPSRIAVELLETVFVDMPSDRFLWQIDALRDAGVRIEIDDFGTGRSSILGLVAIKPDRLKIARELVMPMEEDIEQSNLVSGVLDIARALSIGVLAEGVESDRVARRIAEMGCPLQQGFVHGKPMPIRDFIDVWCGESEGQNNLAQSG